jgi:non-specific serine/threonine protein kinase
VVAPGPLLDSPPACLGPADEDLIREALQGRPGGAPGKTGQLEVRGAAADRVLRALGRVTHALWQEDRSPVGIGYRPVGVVLAGEPHGGGLELRVRWTETGGDPWEPSRARVVDARPPWVEAEGEIRPVAAVEDASALAWLAERGAAVGETDLPAFFGGAVPDLEARGIAVEAAHLDPAAFLLEEVPTPRLYLSEEGGALVATLRFGYGDFEIPADNPEPALRVGVGAHRPLLRRDMDAEFRCALRLRELGFAATDPGRFELEGDAALDFVRRDLQPLSREWEVFGREDLRRHRVTRVAPSLRARLRAGVDWLDLDLEADAGGQTVRNVELVRALRRGGRYVRLGDGSHAELPERWLRQFAAVVEGLGSGSGKRLPLHLAPLLEEILDGADAVEIEGRDLWEGLVGVLSGRDQGPAEPPPPGLRTELRPYQLQGYRWLRRMGRLGLGCVLADDMGLGKTVQALAMLLAEKAGGRGASLVVAPTSVVPNWEAEAARFAPELKVVRYHGVDRKERAGELADHDLAITSYAVLRRDVEGLASVPWNYVILDEAQAIKNAATQTARSARKLRSRGRLALTGTPLENHLGELWSHFQFLVPGLLGTESQFSRRFARPVAQGDEEARETLARRIRPFLLRRLKAEVAQDLPEKVESVLLCELGPEQDRLYRDLLDASRTRVLQEIREKGAAKSRFSVLEALLRLRQACCHPEILPGGAGAGVPSAKFELLKEFVAEVVEEGHRVLVFSQFVKVLTVLRQWFEDAGIPHLYMDGRTRDREERVRRFQEDPSIAAFLVSLKAGGTGLNLTGADYVVLFDPWWNPAVETQATDRAHRIGQTRRVFAYKLIAKGTVEEKVLALQERKRRLTDDLVRSEGTWLQDLTEEDVAALFAP